MAQLLSRKAGPANCVEEDIPYVTNGAEDPTATHHEHIASRALQSELSWCDAQMKARQCQVLGSKIR